MYQQKPFLLKLKNVLDKGYNLKKDKQEIIINMLKEKLDYMIISKVTGKSPIEIKKIEEELMIPNSQNLNKN